MPKGKRYSREEIDILVTKRSDGSTYAQIAEEIERVTGMVRTESQLMHKYSDLHVDIGVALPDRSADVANDEPDTDLARRVRDLEKELVIERQKVSDLHRGLGRHVVISALPENEFSVAIISDTHYGSLYHDSGALRSFLEYAADQGVTEVVHAGDVLEGEHMHFGQERELSHHGVTKQIEAIGETFPHDLGLNVKFITGNHDISYRKASGIDVGAAISDATDWEHIGDMFGEIRYDCPNGSYRLGIMHPGGGTAYALSYRLQKTIEQWEGGKKPHMLVAGHFHKMMSIPSYRNVHGIHPGCFQKQTPFMASKSLAAHVGGLIVRVRVGDDLWNAVTTEFLTYY